MGVGERQGGRAYIHSTFLNLLNSHERNDSRNTVKVIIVVSLDLYILIHVGSKVCIFLSF